MSNVCIQQMNASSKLNSFLVPSLWRRWRLIDIYKSHFKYAEKYWKNVLLCWCFGGDFDGKCRFAAEFGRKVHNLLVLSHFSQKELVGLDPIVVQKYKYSWFPFKFHRKIEIFPNFNKNSKYMGKGWIKTPNMNLINEKNDRQFE